MYYVALVTTFIINNFMYFIINNFMYYVGFSDHLYNQ